MSAPNSNDLPEDVQAQVDAIRDQEGLNDEPQAPEPDVEHHVALSRRQKKEQERNEAVEAAKEAARQAQEALDQERRGREEDRARVERLERSIAEMTAFARGAVGTQQPAPQQSEEDWREKYDKQMKKASEALEAGKMGEYHDRLTRAISLKTQAELAPRIPDPRQFQQYAPPPQAAPEVPAWIRVVENDFPDVITHDRGYSTVAAFIGLIDPKGQARNSDTLRKAMERARVELGTKQRNDAQREQKRQLLAGGGSTGRVAGGTPSKGPSVNVKLPAGFDPRVIAKRAGMTVQEYAKAYGKMNPGDVNQGE